MRFEDGCRTAESAVMPDECPFLPRDGDGVTGAEIGACVAEDGGIVPSAISVFLPAAMRAGAIAS